MEIEIIEKDSFLVMGLGLRTKKWRAGLSIGLNLLKVDMMKIFDKIPDKVDSNIYYGINIDFYKKKGVCSYLFGSEVSTLKNMHPNMESRTIPAGRYVKLQVNPNDKEALAELHIKGKANIGNMTVAGYKYLLEEWIPASAYERADISERFEMYYVDRLLEGVYVCVPIIEKNQTDKA